MVQAQSFGRSAWYNTTLDGRLMAQGGKWLIPLDLQQWARSLPNKGSMELDVLQLPLGKVPWIAKDGSIVISDRLAVCSAPALPAVAAMALVQHDAAFADVDGDTRSDVSDQGYNKQQANSAAGGCIDAPSFDSSESEVDMHGTASTALQSEVLPA